MFLIAHRFGRTEFRIFVLIVSTAVACRKQQKIFKIQHLQIDELQGHNSKHKVCPYPNQLLHDTEN